jgi:hypothetical protein
MAASVSTRVVSWKEAAEMNDSVSSEALVMPRRIGSASAAGRPPLRRDGCRSRNAAAIHLLAARKCSLSPGSVMRTFRSIWRMMISMCLSLMRHALQAVDLLDLGDQEVHHSAPRPEDLEDRRADRRSPP